MSWVEPAQSPDMVRTCLSLERAPFHAATQMVRSLDACISYDHYPHDDIFRTGQKAGWLLLRAARREIEPVLLTAKINMVRRAPRQLAGFHPHPFPSLAEAWTTMCCAD